jgi:hypothetical protein
MAIFRMIYHAIAFIEKNFNARAGRQAGRHIIAIN